MNLYKKPLSSSQYCHTEEEAVTNIQKIPLKTSNKQHFLSIFQLSEILNFDNNSFTICA